VYATVQMRFCHGHQRSILASAGVFVILGGLGGRRPGIGANHRLDRHHTADRSDGRLVGPFAGASEGGYEITAGVIG
jgi:hypothetical protein